MSNITVTEATAALNQIAEIAGLSLKVEEGIWTKYVARINGLVIRYRYAQHGDMGHGKTANEAVIHLLRILARLVVRVEKNGITTDYVWNHAEKSWKAIV